MVHLCPFYLCHVCLMAHVLLEKSTPFNSDHSGYIYIYMYVTIRRSDSYIISVVPACYFGTNPKQGSLYYTCTIKDKSLKFTTHLLLGNDHPPNGSHLMIPDASARGTCFTGFFQGQGWDVEKLKPWRNGSKFIAPKWTLPKFNSLPLKISHAKKERIIFQLSFFQGRAVKLRGCNCFGIWSIPSILGGWAPTWDTWLTTMVIVFVP